MGHPSTQRTGVVGTDDADRFGELRVVVDRMGDGDELGAVCRDDADGSAFGFVTVVEWSRTYQLLKTNV